MTVLKITAIAEASIFSALYSTLICHLVARMLKLSGFGKRKNRKKQ